MHRDRQSGMPRACPLPVRTVVAFGAQRFVAISAVDRGQIFLAVVTPA
jgi:hypothetical protein